MIEIETLQSINYFLALGGLLGILLIAVLVFDLFTKQRFITYVWRFGTLVMLLITLFAVILTQIYSEIFGIAPCGFCWLERVFLYPQLFVIAVGLYLKDKVLPKYVVALSIPGLLIALYHHYIQMGGSQFVACPTAGAGADCAKRILFEFNFVTFPLLAAIAFGLLITISVYILKSSSSVHSEDSLSAQD